MKKSNSNETFCTTNYKRWLALLTVMVITLIVWASIGFDEDRAQANLNRVDPTEIIKHEDPMEMAKLQESYSDIAAKVKAVTVNISASKRGLGMANNNKMNFADPFGTPPRQDVPGGAQKIGIIPEAMPIATAPPISKDAKMPHPYKGVCSNCHPIIGNNKGGNNAAAGPGLNRSSIGSGIIIDPTGYILTNEHIIHNATDVIVSIANGSKYRAELKYTDLAIDLAVLKINTAATLPFAELGDSDLAQEGDIVIAVGNPFGLNQTITQGIISSSNRTVNIGGRNYAALIQTDAAINRGSSGGPLVNIKGEVIGINSAIYSMTGDFTGVGFAVPINRAKESFTSVPSIRAMAANIVDMNVGEVITIAMQPNLPEAWFGAEFASLDPVMADQFGVKSNKGVLVNRVFKKTPAEKAGLVRGDIITKINGRKVRDIPKFQKITSRFNAGEPINLVVNRNGREINMAAVLESINNKKLPKKDKTTMAKAGPANWEWGGIEVSKLTPQLAQRYAIKKGQKGVVVIEAEGMAAAAGILAGDVIRGVNRKKVDNMMEFQSAATNANMMDGVLFDINRQGDPLYLTM